MRSDDTHGNQASNESSSHLIASLSEGFFYAAVEEASSGEQVKEQEDQLA
jgi:hypothetical protein